MRAALKGARERFLARLEYQRRSVHKLGPAKARMRLREKRRNTAGSTRRWALASGLALATMLSTAPLLADSGAGTGDKGTDMVLDLLILRPLGLLTTGVGSLAFVVSLPFTLPSGSTGAAACELVREPFAYTFSRPLGELNFYDGHCQDGASTAHSKPSP